MRYTSTLLALLMLICTGCSGEPNVSDPLSQQGALPELSPYYPQLGEVSQQVASGSSDFRIGDVPPAPEPPPTVTETSQDLSAIFNPEMNLVTMMVPMTPETLQDDSVVTVTDSSTSGSFVLKGKTATLVDNPGDSDRRGVIQLNNPNQLNIAVLLVTDDHQRAYVFLLIPNVGVSYQAELSAKVLTPEGQAALRGE